MATKRRPRAAAPRYSTMLSLRIRYTALRSQPSWRPVVWRNPRLRAGPEGRDVGAGDRRLADLNRDHGDIEQDRAVLAGCAVHLHRSRSRERRQGDVHDVPVIGPEILIKASRVR